MKFIATDGGRAAAGFRGAAQDCVTRAVAVVLERPYAEVYQAFLDRCKGSAGSTRHSHPRSGIFRQVYEGYLVDAGWRWVPTMAFGSGCTVHLRADELPAGRIIARVSQHIVAVVDGVLHDTVDCSRGGTRCVYGYFTSQPPDADELYRAAVLRARAARGFGRLV